MSTQSQHITHHDGPRAFGWCSMAFTDLPDQRDWTKGRALDNGRWDDERAVDGREVTAEFQRLDNHEAAKRAGVFVGLFLGSAAIVAAIIWLLAEVM